MARARGRWGEFRLRPCKEVGRRETVTGEVAGVGLQAASWARALPRRSALQTGFREQKKGRERKEEKGLVFSSPGNACQTEKEKSSK